MTTAAVRVVLCDDTEEVRALLKAAISLDNRFVVVGEAEDGLVCLEVVAEHQPDVVVLDLAMPRLDGLQALPQILEISPNTRIMIFSGFAGVQMAQQTLSLGAHDYVEKGTPIRSVIDRLAGVARDLLDPEEPRVIDPASPETDGDPDITAPVDAVTGGFSELAPAFETRLNNTLRHAAHELRTPASIVRGLATTLVDAIDRLDPATLRRSSDAIRRAVTNLESMIDRIGMAGAIGEQDLELTLEECNIRPLLAEAIIDLDLLFPGHRVRTLVSVDSVVADPLRLREILTELASNALRFSDEDAPVNITVQTEGELVNFHVSDNGVGIADTEAEAIFERFAHSQRARAGVGLGLFVARGLARAHGGDVTHRPKTPTGTTFTLSLPARRREAEMSDS